MKVNTPEIVADGEEERQVVASCHEDGQDV